jgi:hypothetical protein
VPLRALGGDRRTGLWIGLPSRVTGHDKEDRLVLLAGGPPWGPWGAALFAEINSKWTLVPFRNDTSQNIQ